MSNTWVELDLGILGENLRSLKKTLTPGTKIIFVVKANAYGHGMIPVAAHAWKCGVRWFAVAHIDEALSLRELLPEAEIIIVGAVDPADTSSAIKHRVMPVMVDEHHARELASAASKTGHKLRCHAKIDTGMGRIGLPWEKAATVLARLAHLRCLDINGICSHFASANPKDCRFAKIQADRFRTVVSACETAGIKGLFTHVSNSGGILCTRAWDVDGVRPGILLYGYGGQRSEVGSQRADDRRRISITINPQPATHNLQPVTRPFLQWKTRVLQIKKVPAGFPVSYDSTHITRRATNIATIDVGYADGYHRSLSNKGIVLIGGRRCPVVGRVTMNLVMADLGPKTGAKERDEAVLIGTQGKESIWADELGGLAGTISYEVLTSIRTEERLPTG